MSEQASQPSEVEDREISKKIIQEAIYWAGDQKYLPPGTTSSHNIPREKPTIIKQVLDELLPGVRKVLSYTPY